MKRRINQRHHVGRWARRLSVLAAVALVAAGVQSLGPGEASAAIPDRRMATYNIQGGGQKWGSGVTQLLNQGIQVLALQEAGPLSGVPGTQVGADETLWVPLPGGGNGGYTLRHTQWQVGSSTRGVTYHIYFLETDPSGNRVNLAFVSDAPADEVVGADAGSDQGRPALGLRFGTTLYWNVHAAASGDRNNAPALVASIEARSEELGVVNWAAMGDWNRDPGSLASALATQGTTGTHFYRTGDTTQQSGGELDYLVSPVNLTGFQGWRHNGIDSDHYPVSFGPFRAGAKAGLMNVDNSRYLGLADTTTTNGSQVYTNFTTEDSFGGSWYLDPVGSDYYRIRNATTDYCIQFVSADAVAAEFACDASNTQKFDAMWGDTGDPTHLVLKNLNWGRCLNQISDSTIDQVPVVLDTNCATPRAYWGVSPDQDPDWSAPAVN